MNTPLIVIEDDAWNEVIDILDKEYYSLGIESGIEALGNLLDDLYNHRFDQHLEEWGITSEELSFIIPLLFIKLQNEGKMYKSAADWYYGSRRTLWNKLRRKMK